MQVSPLLQYNNSRHHILKVTIKDVKRNAFHSHYYSMCLYTFMNLNSSVCNGLRVTDALVSSRFLSLDRLLGSSRFPAGHIFFLSFSPSSISSFKVMGFFRVCYGTFFF